MLSLSDYRVQPNPRGRPIRQPPARSIGARHWGLRVTGQDSERNIRKVRFPPPSHQETVSSSEQKAFFDGVRKLCYCALLLWFTESGICFPLTSAAAQAVCQLSRDRMPETSPRCAT
ncbi:hypothetical protein N656DRAFT_783752 [Canariomyces notabilis]|uniref:Uncharacterized protein n=1 Tax=Canariomyces notabilis TaxID=2074819 RepID=A0AAN6QEL9_9PEZI|nr:hypothetical protein N656DRAFT_783752 [Canariomyces arenarius]